MSPTDSSCTIAPYFEVREGGLDAFRELCTRCVEQTADEPGCLYYGFSFHGNAVFCREGYRDAEALLDHVRRIGPLLDAMLELATLTRLEVHAPAAELEKLRGPLGELNATFYQLDYGFRS